jgi:hypothetical protein
LIGLRCRLALLIFGNLHSKARASAFCNTNISPAMTSQNATQPVPGNKPSRPSVVILLGLIFALDSLFMLILAGTYLIETGLFSQQLAAQVLSALGDTPGLFVVVRAVSVTVLAVIYPITTVGLFRLRPGAWRSGMVILGIQLAVGLTGFLFDNPATPGLFISVAAVFVLNQHSVRKAFGIVKENRDIPAPIIQRAGDIV